MNRPSPIPEISAALARAISDRCEVTETGCWLWAGATRLGYGAKKVGGRVYAVHRLMYAFAKGDPGNLTIDHLCRRRACCNPAHMEAVTLLENVRREIRDTGTPGLFKAWTEKRERSHCPRGHEYTDRNTIWRAKERHGKVYTGRVCRTCRNASERDRKRRCRMLAKRIEEAECPF